jgi:hypothetical protein
VGEMMEKIVKTKCPMRLKSEKKVIKEVKNNIPV